MEQAIARRQAEEEQHRAEQEQRAREAGQAALERYEQEAERAWLHAGGTRSEFTAAWPELRRKYLAEQAQGRLTARDQRVAAETERLRRSGRYEF